MLSAGVRPGSRSGTGLLVIPSLVGIKLRTASVEYLTTTFAMARSGGRSCRWRGVSVRGLWTVDVSE